MSKAPMKEYYIYQPATLLEVALIHGCFLRFLNYANGTKLRKASHKIPSFVGKPEEVVSVRTSAVPVVRFFFVFRINTYIQIV